MKKLVVCLFLILLVVVPFVVAVEEEIGIGNILDFSKGTIFVFILLGIAIILFIVYWLLQSGLGVS